MIEIQYHMKKWAHIPSVRVSAGQIVSRSQRWSDSCSQKSEELIATQMKQQSMKRNFMRNIIMLLLIILVFGLFIKGMRPSIERSQADFQAYSKQSLLPEEAGKRDY